MRRSVLHTGLLLCVLALWSTAPRPSAAQPFSPKIPITTQADGALSVFAADLDGDGDTDVLSASQNDNTVAWYENDGAQSFTERIVTTSAEGASDVFAADLDGDGDTDILSTSSADNSVTWYENDGTGTFTERTILADARAASDVFAADVDGDGDLDVLSASAGDDTIAWYEHGVATLFTEHIITTDAERASSVFAADVDGDGDTDVLSTSQNDNTVAWYENDGAQSFTEQIVTSDADGASDVFAADLDADGDADILSSSQTDNTIAWYENDGTASFTERTITTSAGGVFHVHVADVDGDGDLDVLSASPNDDTIAWYENDGSGTFTPHVVTSEANAATSVFATDVDGDDNTDILSSSFNDDTIAWYENQKDENDPPTARADRFSVDEDSTLTVEAPGVLANDSDPEGDSLRASLVSGPSSGSVTFNADGSFTYAPTNDFFGADSLTYTATDGDSTDQATVSLTVLAVNDAPSITLAGNLSVTNPASGGTEQTVPNFAIDFDPGPSEREQSILDFRVREVADSADVIRRADVDNDGTLRFVPVDSARGTATMGVQVQDDGGTARGGTDTSRTQTFTITVDTRRGNAPPTARDDAFTTAEDSTLTVDAPGVLANDSDPEGDSLSASLVSNPTNGTLEFQADGAFTYVPNENVNGSDAFTYAASDGDSTDPATVSITVRPVNDAPSVSVTTPGNGASLQVQEPATIEASATDVDGSVARVAFFAGDALLGIDEDGSDGFTTTWTPQALGPQSLVAEATDENEAVGRSDTIAVAVRELEVQTSVTRSFPNPEEQSSFRLVALPGQSSTDLRETVSGTSPEDWRAFRETGRTETRSFSRAECTSTSACAFGPGTGFWLIARQPWDVNQEADAVPLAPSPTEAGLVYRIDVQEGWNVISNPLEVDVPWSTVQDASGTNQALWRWNGRWMQASTFESARSGDAYYFMDDQIDEFVLPFPSGSPPSTSARAVSSTPSSRRTLTLRAVRDDSTVSAVHVGLLEGSRPGLDPADRYGPPGYFGSATLRLVRREDDRRYELATEYQPPGREGYAFDLTLQSEPNVPVTLHATGLRTAFANQEVVLAQRPTGRSFSLRADSTVTLRPDTETTRFRLLVGSENYVEDAHRQVRPEHVELLPSYPNPFRSAATIEYTLPTPQSVRLAVYDVLGRRVAVLDDGRKAAGFHRVQWHGTDANGRSMASGMYLVRLTTDTAVATDRVVLLR